MVDILHDMNIHFLNCRPVSLVERGRNMEVKRIPTVLDLAVCMLDNRDKDPYGVM